MKIRPHKGMTSFIGSLLIRILGATWRIETRGERNLEKARETAPAVVYSFWHGRLVVLSWTHSKKNIQVLASEHYDGDLMGRIIEWLGFGHVKGSSTRGGSRALRELTAVLKSGLDVGLTVDGPRGPRGVVKQGAIELGRLSGSTVVPITSSAGKRILLKSWDRLQIPAPFARVIVEYGEPLVVPPDSGAEERDELRIKLQRELAALTRDLDIELGHKGSAVWPHEDN